MAAFPELAGCGESAAILGVTTQGVWQLRNRCPDFPAPVTQLACGPVWLAEDIREFAKRPRPTGRPPKVRESRKTEEEEQGGGW